jgi:hypothetical protein
MSQRREREEDELAPLHMPRFHPMSRVVFARHIMRFACDSCETIPQIALVNEAFREAAVDYNGLTIVLPIAVNYDTSNERVARFNRFARNVLAQKGRCDWFNEHLVPILHQRGLTPRALLLAAFRQCANVPPSWNVTASLVKGQWRGATVRGADSIEVSVGNQNITGPIETDLLPRNTTGLHASNNAICGVLDVGGLPRRLTSLWLDRCELTGPIDMTLMPPMLDALHLEGNRFTGEIAWQSLPPLLTSFSIAQNGFMGAVDLTALPPRLKELNASRNGFSGPIDLTALPVTLETLSMSDCRLTGALSLIALPPTMKNLVLARNLFDGAATFPVGRPLPLSDFRDNPALTGSLPAGHGQLLYLDGTAIRVRTGPG